MEYIREYYKIPVKIGMKVKYGDRFGKIVSCSGAHLKIKLDGDNEAGKYHPEYDLTYYNEDGSIIKEFGTE